MGWSIGFDTRWNRDIGYGVPATCDFPRCEEKIDRGLGYVCGGDPYGGEHGCGLFFCGEHLTYGRKDMIPLCNRCLRYRAPYKHLSPDVPEWLEWKLTDESWAQWRSENPAEVERMKVAVLAGNERQAR